MNVVYKAEIDGRTIKNTISVSETPSLIEIESAILRDLQTQIIDNLSFTTVDT